MGASESSGISCGRESEGDIGSICCERTFFVLADDRDALSRSDDLEESAIMYARQISCAEPAGHCLVRFSRAAWEVIEAERGMSVLVLVLVSHEQKIFVPWLM